MAPEYVAHVQALFKVGLSVWFPSWALRKRYQLNVAASSAGVAAVRWGLVIAGAAATFAPGDGDAGAWIRIGGGVVFLTFIAWPGLASHATSLLRRLGTGKR